MLPETEFRQRAKEVRGYLKSLKDIQERGNQPGRKFFRFASTLTASKASVFLMIYNCVEQSVKLSIVNIRMEIHSGHHHFSKINDFWQEDVLKANFAEKVSQGTNHLDFMMEVVSFTKKTVDWSEPDRRLPFSGNIDNTTMIKLARKMGSGWKIPKGTISGSYLITVRQHRNDLAHGAETFETVGSATDIDTMIEDFDRIRKFVISFLKSMESYRKRRKYLR